MGEAEAKAVSAELGEIVGIEEGRLVRTILLSCSEPFLGSRPQWGMSACLSNEDPSLVRDAS